MSQRIVSVLAAVALVAGATLAQSPTVGDKANIGRVHARQVSGVPEGTGTVQYDPGAPADAFGIAPPSLCLFGNRFDTRNGSPLSFPGTATGISWYQGASPSPSLDNAVALVAAPLGLPCPYVILDPPIVPFAFNSVAVSFPMPSTRFVGLIVPYYTGLPAYFGSVGLRSATTNAQGFHGIQRSDNGGISNTLAGQNAMVRVSGNIIIPVELLEFEVE